MSRTFFHSLFVALLISFFALPASAEFGSSQDTVGTRSNTGNMDVPSKKVDMVKPPATPQPSPTPKAMKKAKEKSSQAEPASSGY